MNIALASEAEKPKRTEQMTKKILVFVVIITASSLFGGCSLLRQSIAALRSTDHFLIYSMDERLLYEPGAKKYVDTIAGFLDSAVQQIETMQYSQFKDPVRVYICGSRESFKRYFGADVRAGVLVKLFLSPRIFEDGNDVAEMYLTHELSHLHIRDQIGNYKMIKLPTWFKEGLATYAAEGGGAHTVSDEQAIESIKSGKHFVPNDSDGLIFQKTASDWGLRPHMFYRQSMLFIKYLSETNEEGFRKLLLLVENGQRFSAAFETAYNRKLEVLWDDFIKDIEKIG